MTKPQEGSFKLVAYLIAICFRGTSKKEPKNKKIIRKFAKNSKMISMFADCSDNFESSNLRKEILKRN